MTQKKTKKAASAEEKPGFSKQAFLRSAFYRGKEDLLNVLLSDDKFYTTDEVDDLIDNYLKGKVK